MLFDNAYAPTPICTPCRVSMLTGLYPTRHGAFQIGAGPVPALEQPSLATRLGEAGYATACLGKTHFVPRPLEDAHVAGRPLDEQVPQAFWDDFDGAYWGFDFIRHNRGHTSMDAPNGHYRCWLGQQGADLEAIDRLHKPHLTPPPGCPIPVGRWDLPERWHHTSYLTNEAAGWITRQQGPWFAMVNYQDPHAPYLCPEPYFSDVDMTGVELMGLRPGEMDDKPPFYRSLQDRPEYLDDDGRPLKDDLRIPGLFPYRLAEHQADAVRAYIGMVNMLDAYVGRLLGALDAAGQLDNTLICFVSDHGDHLGNHGLWEKGICAYDDSQRIPAILAWPGSEPPARGLVPHHFNPVDILPTFLSAAGIETPVGVQGFDHLPYLRGDASFVRDWSLVDFYTSTKLHQQTLVTGRWKLVLYRNQPWGELYDRAADPEQLDNLYDDPAHAATRAELTHRLVQVNMACSGKPGPRDYIA